MAKQIKLDFEKQKVEINWGGQVGVESSDDLAGRRDDVLHALDLLPSQVFGVDTDFETGDVFVRYHVPNLGEKEQSFLKSIDYGPVDLSNSIRLIEALFNGTLPPSLVQKMMAAEMESDEADPAIKAFLDLLPKDDAHDGEH